MLTERMNKRILNILLTAILSLVVSLSSVLAQDDNTDDIDPIHFKVKVKPDTATIGDVIELNIEVTYPGMYELSDPIITGNENAVTVKDDPEHKSKTKGDSKVDTYKYKLAAFETGEVELPHFEFYYFDNDSTQNSRIAPITTVFIKTTLPIEALTDSIHKKVDPRDIVPIKELPIIWWPYAVGVGVLLLLAAAYWYYQKRKIEAITVPETPVEPPYDVAIRRLHDLEHRDLPGKGKFKNYYFELSEIVRRYIDGRFEIPAAESTTFELKRTLKHSEMSKEQTKDILDMLTRSDMIKFAKQMPKGDEPSKDFAMVKTFVVKTKPREIEEEEAEVKE